MNCCTNNCNQGRACPARQACELTDMPIQYAEPDAWDTAAAWAWWIVGCVAAVCGVVWVLAVAGMLS